jgi:hypothetical protein
LKTLNLKKPVLYTLKTLNFNFAQPCRVGSDMDMALDECGPLAENSAAKLTRSELNTTGLCREGFLFLPCNN